MPLPYAPSLPSPVVSPGLPSPIVAPGISRPVPFIRPGLPAVLPVRPPIPPLLAPLPALGAPVAAPAAGGLARVAVRGAALLGAFGLGLAIGNEVYEEVLDRPFGPSLQDLFFPEGQPEPLPVPERKTAKGQCPDNYCVYVRVIGTTTDGTPFDNGPNLTNSGQCGNLGPLSLPYDGRSSSGSRGVYVDNALGTRVRVRPLSEGFTIQQLIPDHYRQNGQPDICFLPLVEPLPIPSSLPRPTRRPSELPFLPEPLPEPEPLRVPFIPRLPNYPDIPYAPFVPDTALPIVLEPLPPPFLIPSSPRLPQTLREPVTQQEPQLTVALPITTTQTPPTPGLECCPSLERKLDDLIDRDECEPCDLTGIEEQLRLIAEKLSVEGIGSVNLTPCDAEGETIEVYAGEGIDGIFDAITAITKSLDIIHNDTKCAEECVSSVPDWWQVRKGADTPQLSIVFRKQGTRNYHSLNIPHPIVSPRPTVSAIEPYEGGQWQATIYLRDNSKFIVCAKLKGDAIRVATQAASMIEPEWLPSPLEIATTERRGFAVNQSLMEPRYMDFHPEGQKSRRALWRVRLAE